MIDCDCLWFVCDFFCCLDVLGVCVLFCICCCDCIVCEFEICLFDIFVVCFCCGFFVVCVCVLCGVVLGLLVGGWWNCVWNFFFVCVMGVEDGFRCVKVVCVDGYFFCVGFDVYEWVLSVCEGRNFFERGRFARERGSTRSSERLFVVVVVWDVCKCVLMMDVLIFLFL